MNAGACGVHPASCAHSNFCSVAPVRSCRLAVEAVELDPVVVQLARQHFGLPEGSHLQVRRRPKVPSIDQLAFHLPTLARRRNLTAE